MSESIIILPPKVDPLKDTLILEQIFSNLSLSDLKCCRQVCRLWSAEGAKNFRGRRIHIHLLPLKVGQGMGLEPYKQPLKNRNWRVEKDRKALAGFLNRFRLPHILHISLLDFYSWKGYAYNIGVKKGKSVIEENKLTYFRQRNNLEYSENLVGNILPQLFGLPKELFLELSLREEQDLDAFEAILELLEANLERVYLNLVIFNDKLQPSKKNHQQSAVKTFSLRMPGQFYIGEVVHHGASPPLSPPGASILLSLFPNVTFLDIIGFRPLHGTGEVDELPGLLSAARERSTTLSGFRARLSSPSDLNALLDHCIDQPLSSIFLDICYKIEIEPLQELLDTSIEALDIIWRPRGGRETLKIPAKLKSLSLTSSAKFSCCWDYTPWLTKHSESLDDLFGLGKNFPQNFKALSLILFWDDGIWDRIFPPPVQMLSRNLTTLVITLTGECESEEIQKFPQNLFPNLRIFRHGRMADNGRLLFVCQHKYDPDTRKLLGKWEWLGGVANYLFGEDVSIMTCHFHSTRHRFRHGLELEDQYFTDTAWHLECEEHHIGWEKNE